MKKTLLLMALLFVANGVTHTLYSQTSNNDDENLIVLKYQDYKFFDDEPDYKLFEDQVFLGYHTFCESTQKFYVFDNYPDHNNVIEYDLKNALNKDIEKRSFHLPFIVETTSNTMVISPNGQWLAFVDENGENLHIVNASNGNEVASCKMGQEFANEKLNINEKYNNIDIGHPFNFLSNNEILVTGARKALLYNIEKNSSTILSFDKKYYTFPKNSVTSKGTISGFTKTTTDETHMVTFFVEKGKIENTIEGLHISESSDYYIYNYQNKEEVEYYDKLTGNKVEFIPKSDMKSYRILYNKEKKSTGIRFDNLQGNASKYSTQQQEILKKYWLVFNERISWFGWLQDNRIMFINGYNKEKQTAMLTFFNHTLTDNEIAKQALLTAINDNNIDAIDQFIADFKDSRYVTIAKQKKKRLEMVADLLPKKTSGSGPIIQFNTEKLVYGRIPDDKAYTCEFEITNVGDQPLTIAVSGGTEPALVSSPYGSFLKGLSFPKEPIMPGETKLIQANFTLVRNPYNKEMILNNKIIVTSNGKPQRCTLIIDTDSNTSNGDLVKRDAKGKEYYYNNAMKASYKDAVTYLKECPYSDYRETVENEIVTNKVKDLSSAIYCIDNYPKLAKKMENKMFGYVSSVSNFKTYMGYYPFTKSDSELDDKLYQCVSASNEEDDCNYYLKVFPNGNHKSAVTAQKNEIASYNAARSGGKAECIAYLTKYPNGRFTSEIQSKKDDIVKEEQRLAQIKTNSNKGIWKLGNKLCNCTSDGIIMATLDQWNEDHSSFKGIITASPGGLFQGDLLQKGNQLWFETKGWHKCLDDEVEFALSHDKSLEAEQLMKAKKMKFAKGTVVAHTYYSSGWFFSSSYRVTAKVDDWNDDYTRMKIQIVKTGGLDYIDGESIYEGKYIWVSPVGWE